MHLIYYFAIFIRIKLVIMEVYIPPFQILTILPQEQSTTLSRDLRKVVTNWQQSENIVYTKLLSSLPSMDAQTDLKPTSASVNNVASNNHLEYDTSPNNEHHQTDHKNLDHNIDHRTDHNTDYSTNPNSDLNIKLESYNSNNYQSSINIDQSNNNQRNFSELKASLPTKSPNLKSSSKSSSSKKFNKSGKSGSKSNNKVNKQNKQFNSINNSKSNYTNNRNHTNFQSKLDFNEIKSDKQSENANYEVLQNDAQYNQHQVNDTNNLLNNDAINSKLLENNKQSPPSMMWTRLRLTKANSAHNSLTIRPADIPLFSSPLPVSHALGNVLPLICDHIEIHNPSLILSLLDTERFRAASFISQAAFIPMLSYTGEYQTSPTSTHVSISL